MRVLHTSDWHLGRALYSKRRYPEFAAFLDWVLLTLEQQSIDILIIAGDIFDTGTPSNRAQRLYYEFLGSVGKTPCRHVVVVGGNHDSPSFLNAPKQLLQAMQVHVVGSIASDIADDVIVLRDTANQPQAIICAVPYLRDQDMRKAAAGETLDIKEQKLLAGVRDHYKRIGDAALDIRASLAAETSASVPIIATGHLFVAGGKTLEGDGVRDLYVGSLAHVSAQIFPPCFDYVALGHLHVPQRVGGHEYIRYCGSPIPMGFGEAKQQKQVCVVTFTDAQPPTIAEEPVPVFQTLARVKGDWDSLKTGIEAWLTSPDSVWLEVIYDGAEIMVDLRERLLNLIDGSQLEILRIKNTPVMQRAMRPEHTHESLDDLDEHQVFQRCLDAHEVPESQRPELIGLYGEVLTALQDADQRAE